MIGPPTRGPTNMQPHAPREAFKKPSTLYFGRRGPHATFVSAASARLHGILMPTLLPFVLYRVRQAQRQLTYVVSRAQKQRPSSSGRLACCLRRTCQTLASQFMVCVSTLRHSVAYGPWTGAEGRKHQGSTRDRCGDQRVTVAAVGVPNARPHASKHPSKPTAAATPIVPSDPRASSPSSGGCRRCALSR